MLVRIGFDITFEAPTPVPIVMMLYVHPSRLPDLRGSDAVEVDPSISVEEFRDSFGNRCGRIMAPAGPLRLRSDCFIEDSGRPEPTIHGLRQVPVESLPSDTLPYLLPSRYCEVDLLSDHAWNLFGSVPEGWQRVQAVLDWVHANVQFGYPHASAHRTALGVWQERKGVCRDFQHLAITFCRALNVPARYATGYLGDIGVPANPSPMDFSACMEVFLEGRWITLDARHNTPRIARVLMARGRDAADVALTTAFGNLPLKAFRVWTDEVPSHETSLAYEPPGTEAADEPEYAAAR